MQMPNKLYDILKWIALIALDACGVLYKSISDIWGMPYGDKVVGTCAAISVFIGALLQISSYKYRGGK